MSPTNAAKPLSLSPGMRYMVLGAFFFSVMSLGVKLLGARVPSQEVVLVRGVMNAILSYLLLRRARLSARGTRPGVLMLRGLFGFGALSCLYFALTRLPLADATVLQYTNPVWTALFAAWYLQERLERWEAAMVVASLAGVVLIARPSFLFGAQQARLDLVAVAVGLAGAMFSACAYITVRKLSRTEHPLLIVYYFTLVTVGAALPGTLLSGPVWPTPTEWLFLLLVGLTAQAGQVYLTRGLQLEPAGRATAAGYLQIVFAAVWGMLFFDDYPDAWMIAGAAIILGSTLLIARRRSRAETPGAPGVTGVGEEVKG